MTCLVTGGAGYVGSHFVKLLTEKHIPVIVFDDFSKGHEEAAINTPIIRGSLLKPEDIQRAFNDNEIDSVFHFAALCYVGESVQKPALYWKNNVTGTRNLLDETIRAGVNKFVFSSSAAVYGNPDTTPIPEEHPREPINPYGRTKLAVEWMLEDYSRAYGLKYAALRYFNAAGAALDGSIGEDHDPETHIIPLILQCALGLREEFHVFGTDYDTPDGSCVRDYIHVEDLAEAHLKALKHLDQGSLKVNLGTGSGYSVKEVVETARKITGKNIKAVESPRREGDPAKLVASSDKAKEILGWEPRHSELETIMESAWNWHRGHPRGYASKGS